MDAARLVIGMTGGRGLAYGVRLLELLRERGIETHVVADAQALEALGRSARGLADHVYAPENQAAPISSGSFLTRGMILAPCSRSAFAAITRGLASNLVYRAADVTLKEARPLVLGVPEAPPPLEAPIPGLAVVALEGETDDAARQLLEPLRLLDCS